MEYRSLGRTQVQVSAFCLSGLALGREADERTSLDIVHRFFDAGGNFLDLANIYAYGEAEALATRAIQGHRHNVVLMTKIQYGGLGLNRQGLTRYHILNTLDDSLRRLKTDYIDVYQLQGWPINIRLEDVLLAMDTMVRQGKVRCLAVSGFAAWQIMKALSISEIRNLARFDCFQPRYSLFEREPEREFIPLCQAENLGVVPWNPIGNSLFARHARHQNPYSLDQFESFLERIDMGAPGDAPYLTESTGGTGADLAKDSDSDAENAQAGSQETLATKWTAERNRAILSVVSELADQHSATETQIALAWVKRQHGVTASIINVQDAAELGEMLAAQDIQLSKEELARLDQVSALEDVYPYGSLKRLARALKRNDKSGS